jgi:hypothetical protein
LTMFISTTDYLHRITYALEHVIAPQIESDYLRGQLLAAVYRAPGAGVWVLWGERSPPG